MEDHHIDLRLLLVITSFELGSRLLYHQIKTGASMLHHNVTSPTFVSHARVTINLKAMLFPMWCQLFQLFYARVISPMLSYTSFSFKLEPWFPCLKSYIFKRAFNMSTEMPISKMHYNTSRISNRRFFIHTWLRTYLSIIFYSKYWRRFHLVHANK